MADLFDKYIVNEPTTKKAPDLFDRYAPGGGGVQDWEPRQYSTGEKAGRAVGLVGQGVNNVIANVAGAPVDAAAWLLRQVGVNADKPIGGSESIKKGLRSLTGTIEPTNTLERTAEGVGEGVGNALTVLLPATAVANTARAGTVTQGVANALATQPVAQVVGGAAAGGVTAATDNPLLGLAAGLAVPVAASAARRAVTPVRNVLSPQEQNIVGAAGREGVRLTPAQQTGSPTLKGLEGVMATTPGPSGPMQRTLRGQRTDFNRAVLTRAGITADDASPDTVNRGFRVLGQTFDDLASRTTLNVDRQFTNDVQRAATDYGRRLPTDVAPVFQSYMDDLSPLIQATQTPGANPQMAGEIYQRIRSDIGKRIRGTNNLDLKEALGSLQTALDDVAERSTSGALRQEWQEARRQYQALMTVDKAMRGGTQADRSTGNVPLNALRQAVVSGDQAGYARGRGQLNELSRVGDFIGQRVPSSGTSEREAVLNPLKWPVMYGMNLLARGYNTPAANAYLTNQVAGPADWRALYGGLAARQALEEGTEGRNALVNRRGGR